MNLYYTEVKAIEPKNGRAYNICGSSCSGISYADAMDYCQRNGLGYLNPTHLLIGYYNVDDVLPVNPDFRLN